VENIVTFVSQINYSAAGRSPLCLQALACRRGALPAKHQFIFLKPSIAKFLLRKEKKRKGYCVFSEYAL